MVLPEAKIEIVPMADGGEGTAEVICQALGGSWFTCKAHDPFGREIKARYAWIDNRNLAVMEMSEAAGMRRLSPNELDPDRASTFGVGEMILDAADRGAEEIIIGLGGSATNDGGFGMARALGFRFIAENKELTGRSELDDLHSHHAALTRSCSPPLREQESEGLLRKLAANYCSCGCKESVAGQEWRDSSIRSAKRSDAGQDRSTGTRADEIG